jgi:hypothetical protein
MLIHALSKQYDPTMMEMKAKADDYANTDDEQTDEPELEQPVWLALLDQVNSRPGYPQRYAT